ncbi:RICIN domain-containing protein [Streptomyces sp. NPDC059340]|uniref:RICIN domain-containing protein n=1 Tax=Streptomyces sp. NPDC059340 TaxID=3346806 RepID=UPI0036C02A8E
MRLGHTGSDSCRRPGLATVSIKGVPSGLCLDVTSGATINGTPMELWPCTGSSNQRWTTS